MLMAKLTQHGLGARFCHNLCNSHPCSIKDEVIAAHIIKQKMFPMYVSHIWYPELQYTSEEDKSDVAGCCNQDSRNVQEQDDQYSAALILDLVF